MNETAFPTPSSDRTEIVSSAPDAIPPAEPVGMPDQPPRTHEVSASFGGGIDYLGSVAVDSNIPASVPRRAAGIEQPPQPWLSSGVQFQDTPLPLRPSDVKATPTVMDGERPPTVPPSGGEIPGASPPNPTGLVGAEAKSAAETTRLTFPWGCREQRCRLGPAPRSIFQPRRASRRKSQTLRRT